MEGEDEWEREEEGGREEGERECVHFLEFSPIGVCKYPCVMSLLLPFPRPAGE